MLRISAHEDDQKVRLQIEGALAGCWVKELEVAWRTARAALQGRSLWVDLTGVTRVDTAGQYLLRLIHKDGAQFSKWSQISFRPVVPAQASDQAA